MSKTLYPNSIRIGLMNPSIAQIWAQRILSDGTTVGSIKKGDTINHTTSQPIATGLFCQRIFGPCTDYTCACGHEKIRIGFNPNIAPPVCSDCHVEWTHASVRRQFLGSIDLISPVTHKWFSDSRGAYIPTLVGITPRTFRNLKECKLFFPFGLKKNQELTEYSNETKKGNGINGPEQKIPFADKKGGVSTFRAMQTLQFLIDPQKYVSPRCQENLQLTNKRDFYFLSDKLLHSGNGSIKNIFSKFSDVRMLTDSTSFTSTGLAVLSGLTLKQETNLVYSKDFNPFGWSEGPPSSSLKQIQSISSGHTKHSKHSIQLPFPSSEISSNSISATKTFGKEPSFNNLQNSINKVFLPLQARRQKFLEKDSCSKNQNFYSLISATQWLTIEQALSLKVLQKPFLRKGSFTRLTKTVESSKGKNQNNNVSATLENTNNPIRLKPTIDQIKNQNPSLLAGSKEPSFDNSLGFQSNSISGLRSPTHTPKELMFLNNLTSLAMAHSPKGTVQSLIASQQQRVNHNQGLLVNNKGELNNQPLLGITGSKSRILNDDLIFNWKAKFLLSETNRGKKIPRSNLSADPKGTPYLKSLHVFDQDNLKKKKKENLKYVFVLADKIESSKRTIFSESFSLLALQNKQASLKYQLHSTKLLSSKEKPSTLVTFFENILKIKKQSSSVLGSQSRLARLWPKGSGGSASNIEHSEYLPTIALGSKPETPRLTKPGLILGKATQEVSLLNITPTEEARGWSFGPSAGHELVQGIDKSSMKLKESLKPKTDSRRAKIVFNKSFLVSKNVTSIFRDFTKYKLKVNTEILFGKHERPDQLSIGSIDFKKQLDALKPSYAFWVAWLVGSCSAQISPRDLSKEFELHDSKSQVSKGSGPSSLARLKVTINDIGSTSPAQNPWPSEPTSTRPSKSFNETAIIPSGVMDSKFDHEGATGRDQLIHGSKGLSFMTQRVKSVAHVGPLGHGREAQTKGTKQSMNASKHALQAQQFMTMTTKQGVVQEQIRQSTNKRVFSSKILKFQTISNYMVGVLANSKIGLCRTLCPFSLKLFLPQKNTLVLKTVKGLFQQSNSKELVNKEKSIFAYSQCNYLLRSTGTKLWYLKQKETLVSLVLKANFYGFKRYFQSNQKAYFLRKNSLLNKYKTPSFKIKEECSDLLNLLSTEPLTQEKERNIPQICVKNSGFEKHHNFPIRPSYTQPEDYRRQFIKFLGKNSLIQNTDVPISRYSLTKTQLINKGQISENTSNSLAQKSFNFLSPHAIEVYFSEAKSYAKEQTIKTILSQTGGGGLQRYLELVNLSELVLILQNDLAEISPRLAKSQSTRRVLLSIINDTSNSLTETLFSLHNASNNNKKDYGKSIETTTSSWLSLGSNQEKSDKEKNLSDNSRNLLVPTDNNDFIVEKKKSSYYPNQLLLSEKIEILEKKCKDVKKEYKAVKKICSDFQNRKNAHKRRYKLAFQLLRTMSNPAGMTMSSVPVLPPGLRPIIDVPKIGPITADLNIRYRSLLFALRNLRELAYVDFRNAGAAQASVQEAVDDLLYTGGKTRREKSNTNPNLYKSLAMRLKGKHGRFRGNLLGKRVDYSGRSVIVVGPTLKIHQCGLPFEIAIKLFNPFLIRSLIQRGFCKNVYKAKQILIRGKFKPLIWTLCQEVMSEHLVLLNRAPTLHRLGVQAFMPVLISGRAILLHPLVCTGFNADFDGDQMGVHVPLFPQARAEAWKMMWSRNNFLLPSSGEPVLLPSQDMVLGCYYLTSSTQKVLETPVETPEYNDSFSFPFRILNIKTALNGYTKGTYNIQSIVWINLNKTTYVKLERFFHRYHKKNTSIKLYNPEIQKMEDDGLLAPTLELRITPFGVMRLVYAGGIKSFTFQNSLLLPGRQTVKPPVFAIFVRTTIGRLIFNNLLEDLRSS